MRYIYRVANKINKGPYYRRDYRQWTVSNHNNPRTHPNANTDNLFWSCKEEYFFGFTSIKKLYSWFTLEEIEKLDKLGFYINVIPMDMIEDIKHGKSKKQIIFKIKK